MDSLQEAIKKARLEREGRIGKTAAPGESGAPQSDMPSDSSRSGVTRRQLVARSCITRLPVVSSSIETRCR